MKLRIGFVFIIGLIFMANKCYHEDELILVNNQTKDSLYIIPGFVYSDTTAFNKSVICCNESTCFVGPFSSNRVFSLPLTQKNVWDSLVKSDTLFVYAFTFMKNTGDAVLIGKYVITYNMIKQKDFVLEIN